MISPGFVADALACMREQGIAAAPLLAEAGLAGVPTEPVTSAQYGQLWHAMARAAQDEFFGLGARPMRPGSFTLLCHAVLHAGTLERALRRALRFLRVVLDDPSGALELREGLAEIVLTDRGTPRSAFAYRTYWLILMGLACWLVGRRIPLRRLDFACPAPDHRRDYRQFFGAPVQFGRPASRLTFDADHLALPLIRIEAPRGNYDYQNKYFTDEVKYHCPSGLDEELEQEIQALVMRAARLIDCRGWGRADLMLGQDGKPWLLEINTSPGMTSHSLVPMAARAVGIEFGELCLRILESARLG